MHVTNFNFNFPGLLPTTREEAAAVPDTILWGICGASLVVGGAASFGLYRQCRTAQVNLL